MRIITFCHRTLFSTQVDQAFLTQDLHQPAAATSLPGNMGHAPDAAVPPWYRLQLAQV